MSDPVSFLTAKLDEAEELAKAAKSAAPTPWHGDLRKQASGKYYLDIDADDGGSVIYTDGGWRTPTFAVARLLLANDPDVVLRRIAADRKILALCVGAIDHVAAQGLSVSDWTEGMAEQARATLLALAEGWGWPGEDSDG